MATIETYVVSAGKATIKKDPNATLDYSFDWTAWLALAADTIASVVWIKDAALTVVSQSFTARTATVFLSGGVAGTVLSLTCRITTNSTPPRVEDRTVYLKIVER